MLITPDRIRALAPGCKADIVNGTAPTLDAHARTFGIVTRLRCAHFMAQVAHESAGFTRLEENLNYTSARRIALVWPWLKWRAHELVLNPEALANAAYAHRFGNGAEDTGDGWRFRGRGLIQLTCRSNYMAYSDAVGVDLCAFPDRAAKPEMAALLALAFWKRSGCNQPAERDDTAEVTRLINGPALRGLAERRALTRRAKEIFIEGKGENA